ncbi:hypothetical protein HELRODRAFT_106700 [Helobdella robusta]|uniref:Nudix hydrolase domain-containing protein n=1 Tax=Helobdella robusta TaxID=6412 RepID=T1EE38_HELRO|nr:hypothetical protein HELRODRAFT_106700 [Helobdella robusta]ESO02530.1 hypothetical protein HELRODRAFT_106700 [Helobdella robusta]
MLKKGLFFGICCFASAFSILKQVPNMHYKCRNSQYPRSNLMRLHVPDDKVPWNVEFPDYFPISYTDPSVYGKPWADVDFEKEGANPQRISWNQIDTSLNVDRTSFTGNYRLNTDGLPMNPMGRTGIKGRGLLGRWGPNHAGDPIVTRWARDLVTKSVKVDSTTKKPILQFVSIQRKDSKEWAIPGGMVDPGEMITETLKREFAEEALNCLEKTEAQRKAVNDRLDKAFKNGVEVYKGYVDDPRNTDNAWMETVAYNFHDDKNDIFNMNFKAGDDAIGVRWMNIDRNIKLYASHKHFIEKVVQLRGAHW